MVPLSWSGSPFPVWVARTAKTGHSWPCGAKLKHMDEPNIDKHSIELHHLFRNVAWCYMRKLTAITESHNCRRIGTCALSCSFKAPDALGPCRTSACRLRCIQSQMPPPITARITTIAATMIGAPVKDIVRSWHRSHWLPLEKYFGAQSIHMTSV